MVGIVAFEHTDSPCYTGTAQVFKRQESTQTYTIIQQSYGKRGKNGEGRIALCHGSYFSHFAPPLPLGLAFSLSRLTRLIIGLRLAFGEVDVVAVAILIVDGAADGVVLAVGVAGLEVDVVGALLVAHGGALRSGGEGGDEARDEGSKGGQARAGERGGELTQGPARGFDVLPGHVLGDLEILDADDGDGDGEETERENAEQDQALSAGQVEVLDDGEGEQEDGNVGGNVAGGVDVELGVVGDALGLDGRVPEALDGAAHEKADEELRQTPGGDDDDGADVDLAHVLDGHDAVVLEQQGELGGKQARAVKHDADPEALFRRKNAMLATQDQRHVEHHGRSNRRLRVASTNVVEATNHGIEPRGPKKEQKKKALTLR